MIENLFRPTHLILVLAVVLIIFGPQKLPDLGAALGKSIREFKNSFNPEDKGSGSAETK